MINNLDRENKINELRARTTEYLLALYRSMTYAYAPWRSVVVGLLQERKAI